MSFIPDKNLFIVTSSLKPNIGHFNDEERFSQTIASLKSLREKVPDAVVLFVDCSARPVTELEKGAISNFTNFYMDLSLEPTCKYCVENGLKSPGENHLLYITLMLLKQNPQLVKVLAETKRIFKYSSRTILEDDFDIKDYDNLFGKFTFKKRMPTWMNQTVFGADHLLITRLYSFCTSLVDTYLGVLVKNLDLLQKGIPDTEHAHFVNIPKQHLIEFEKIHCFGWLAGNRQIEHY